MHPYLTHLIILAVIYAIMTLAMNVAVGYTGLINFGTVALVGIGAYTFAILSALHGVPFWWAAISAVVVAALAGTALALPAKKIRGDYYALITLGFLFVASAVFVNFDWLTRGTLGILGIPRPPQFITNASFVWFVLGALALVYGALHTILNSPFGRALEAVRDDEDVAASLGKPVFKLKGIALTISGAVCGISGVLLASYVQFIGPNSFWLELLVWALAAMIVGGLASLPGSVIGTAALFILSEPLRFLSIPPALIGPLRLIIFMVLLIAVIIYRPKGMIGRAQLEE